jgi:hypothetical protein
MKGHLRRCQSALRAHVRYSTLRAQGLLPPCIWRFLNRLPRTRGGQAQRPDDSDGRLVFDCDNTRHVIPAVLKRESSDCAGYPPSRA